MNRRSFLRTLGTAAAGAAVGAQVVDLERLTWVPGAKSFFFPWSRRPVMIDRELGISIRFIETWKAQREYNGLVSMVNESLFNPPSNIAESFKRDWPFQPTRLDVLYGWGSLNDRMVRVHRPETEAPLYVEQIDPRRLYVHKDAFAMVMDPLSAEPPADDLSNVLGIKRIENIPYEVYRKRFRG